MTWRPGYPASAYGLNHSLQCDRAARVSFYFTEDISKVVFQHFVETTYWFYTMPLVEYLLNTAQMYVYENKNTTIAISRAGSLPLRRFQTYRGSRFDHWHFNVSEYIKELSATEQVYERLVKNYWGWGCGPKRRVGGGGYQFSSPW